MQLMVLKPGCYACEKGTPESKTWIAEPKPERVQSFGFRNKVRKLNKEVWPVGKKKKKEKDKSLVLCFSDCTFTKC